MCTHAPTPRNPHGRFVDTASPSYALSDRIMQKTGRLGRPSFINLEAPLLVKSGFESLATSKRDLTPDVWRPRQAQKAGQKEVARLQKEKDADTKKMHELEKVLYFFCFLFFRFFQTFQPEKIGVTMQMHTPAFASEHLHHMR